MMAHVKIGLIISGMFLAALAALADTNLVTTRTWVVDGADASAPDARKINIVVDRAPVGAFSELKFYFNFDGTNAMQVFSVKGSGVIRPSLPPPGVPGGAFLLTGYWDCDAGFIDDMNITDLEFRSRGGSKTLLAHGKIANGDSLEANDLMLKFHPAQTNDIAVDVRYRLVATRDFCVDMTHHPAQEEFQVARMIANFISAQTNQNNRIRLVKLDSRICDPYTGCHSSKSSLCADLANTNQYVFGKPRLLADDALVLLHTNQSPYNTPTLAINFHSPIHSQLRAQGHLTTTDDPTVPNVTVWGNWVGAHKRYKSRRSVGRFRYTLEARDPNDPHCDSIGGH
jgi:hypothetical protein